MSVNAALLSVDDATVSVDDAPALSVDDALLSVDAASVSVEAAFVNPGPASVDDGGRASGAASAPASVDLCERVNENMALNGWAADGVLLKHTSTRRRTRSTMV